MTTYVYDSFIDRMFAFATPASGDSVIVGPQALLNNSLGSGFDIFTQDNTLTVTFVIEGIVNAAGNAIEAFNTALNPIIHVGATGVVSGSVGISFLSDNAHIFNQGLIVGSGSAIILGGTVVGGHDTSIINYGTISGGTNGIVLLEGALERIVLDNHGVLGSSVASVAFTASDTTLTNDIIRNTGDIYGDVFMGGGNDLFDARGGITLGTIHLGPGDDRYIPGTAQETVEGGTGISHDVLDFRFTSGVTFALDGAFEATGVADGDVYTGFAYLVGSNSGADHLRGDNQINRITGGGGADVLEGAGGNDFLIGGNGADTMTGGTGDDRFVYNRLAETPDLILDFSNSAGDNDTLQFARTGFDPGLASGTLSAARFQSRTDNLAQDADDRFIFRTTDKTLWFDADGNGSAAPVLLVDLQANATFTAADILMA